jgi:hypothetical protein
MEADLSGKSILGHATEDLPPLLGGWKLLSTQSVCRDHVRQAKDGREVRVVEDLIQPVMVISVRVDMFSKLILMIRPRTAVESSLQLFAKLGRDGIVGGRNVKIRPIWLRMGRRKVVRGTFFVAVMILCSVSAVVSALFRMRIRSR